MPVSARARLEGVWGLAARSLSGRLLLLTLLYLLATQVLIFVPAIGIYHRELLDGHILSAELAVLPFTEPGGAALPASAREDLLRHADADAVMLKRSYRRDFFQIGDLPMHIDRTIDLTTDTVILDMVNGIDCLFRGGSRTLYVLARSRIKNAQSIGIILNETTIRSALIAFAHRAITAALFISAVTAALVFASLYYVMVRPMRRITHSMVAFRENPEDAARILAISNRADEIGVAERELSAMQRDLYASLRQKARLAALGSAVARIQHDLRNILSSAQLASDRLVASEDPAAKRLVAAIDHAIALATSTLKYGRAEEAAPQREALDLAAVVDEVAQSVLEGRPEIVFENRIQPDFTVMADREQVFRMLLNVVRNAAQAQEGAGLIVASAERRGGMVETDIADNGPGVPQKVLEHLFEPFASAARPGGSGLGLAIARDLARAHGGDLKLVASSTRGAVFRILLPDRSSHGMEP